MHNQKPIGDALICCLAKAKFPNVLGALKILPTRVSASLYLTLLPEEDGVISQHPLQIARLPATEGNREVPSAKVENVLGVADSKDMPVHLQIPIRGSAANTWIGSVLTGDILIHMERLLKTAQGIIPGGAHYIPAWRGHLPNMSGASAWLP